MMNWISVNDKQPNSAGVYWVQSRHDLAHLKVRYHSAYWNGYKWYIDPGGGVYYWSYIKQAPEPEGTLYYDELGRLDIVAAQERGVDLQTYVGQKDD